MAEQVRIGRVNTEGRTKASWSASPRVQMPSMLRNQRSDGVYLELNGPLARCDTGIVDRLLGHLIPQGSDLAGPAEAHFDRTVRGCVEDNPVLVDEPRRPAGRSVRHD